MQICQPTNPPNSKVDLESQQILQTKCHKLPAFFSCSFPCDLYMFDLKHSYTLCVNSLDIIGCWQLDPALLVTRRSFHLPFNSRQVSWSKWMPWKGSTKIHCSFIILCPFVWKRRIQSSQSSSVLCTLYWQTVPISGFNIQHVQMHKSIRIHYTQA